MKPLGNTFIADLSNRKVNVIKFTKIICTVGYSAFRRIKTQPDASGGLECEWSSTNPIKKLLNT